jgi:manganese-dependent ADP-ribose/CDP-alcohol diphosphatase
LRHSSNGQQNERLKHGHFCTCGSVAAALFRVRSKHGHGTGRSSHGAVHRLITDVQYADVDDGWNYARTQRRYYRHALVLLRSAIDEWIHQAARTAKPLKFAVNMGDLIDGKNRPAGTTRAALESTLAAWRVLEERGGAVHHILGNHELYNMTQREFERDLKLASAAQVYYDFTEGRTRFIVLNAYGVSSLGREPSDPIHQEATALLRRINPNADLNSPLGLHREQKRFVEYNGAVDAQQLTWLQATLAKAQDAEENVVIFSHIPIHPRSCPANCLLWNYKEVLAIVLDYAACVRAVFAGHVHGDGYAREKGVHFLVCDAVLECDPESGETAHATVDVYEDRLVVNGYGKIPSRVLAFQ